MREWCNLKDGLSGMENMKLSEAGSEWMYTVEG